MRVFMTGATGFIGGYLIPELVAAGHQVSGLSRSDAGDAALARAGAQPVRGDLDDLAGLRAAAADADGVIHAAFNHDFSDIRRHAEADRGVIAALGQALAGSDRPLVVSSGTGLARRDGVRPATETDPHYSAAEFARAATEEAADALVAAGVRAVVMRLSQVHDTRRQGRIAEHIRLARWRGYVAYVGEGANRLAAVHATDAARLYRLALERGQAGARYNAVAEGGVPLCEIADVIGQRLDLPVRSIAPEEAAAYFGPIAPLAQLDLAASSALTRQALGWQPTGPGLLADLAATDMGAV